MNIILFLLFITPMFLQAGPRLVTNFNDLVSFLKEGNTVRIIINYSNCSLRIDGKEERSIEAIGGMQISNFEYFAKGAIRNELAFLAVSENQLISHSKFGVVYNYVKVRVYENDSVEINAKYLEPKSFDVLMDETFYTIINKGGTKGGASFFIE